MNFKIMFSTFFIGCYLISVTNSYSMAQKPETEDKQIDQQPVQIKPSTIKPPTPEVQPIPALKPPSEPIPQPIYLCELPNINDYQIFANSGWDGNWYVGYNVCWIEKLPPAPPSPTGAYQKAFIGAKIGRAKTRSISGRSVWEKEPIPGSIYIGISSTPAWPSANRYFLVNTFNIPLEGDPGNALEGIGEARWFWTEIPLTQVNFTGPNFIALYSPTDYFVSRDTAPILCGGWGARDAGTNTYLNDEIQGSPPISAETSLKTPISVPEPAIALKLIPTGTEQEINVFIVEIREGEKGTADKTIVVDISGNQIEKCWLEVATATNLWKKVSKFLYNPPYIFTLKPVHLPKGKISVRVVAEDVWGNKGYSRQIGMLVERNGQ